MRKPNNSKDSPDGLVALRHILNDVLEKKTGRRATLRNFKIWEVWDKAVGEAISRHAQPTSFQNGKLFVAVSHPTWITELSFRREELKQKINQKLQRPMVDEIIFRLRNPSSTK